MITLSVTKIEGIHEEFRRKTSYAQNKIRFSLVFASNVLALCYVKIFFHKTSYEAVCSPVLIFVFKFNYFFIIFLINYFLILRFYYHMMSDHYFADTEAAAFRGRPRTSLPTSLCSDLRRIGRTLRQPTDIEALHALSKLAENSWSGISLPETSFPIL